MITLSHSINNRFSPAAGRWKTARLLILGAVIVLLAGCTTRLIYNNLDWIIPWYIDDLVSLTDQQALVLETALPRHLDRHRSHYLPEYIAFIDEVSAVVRDGTDEARMTAMFDQVRNHWRQLMAEIEPDTVAIMTDFDDEQTAELFANLEDSNRERQDELDAMSAQAQQALYRDRTLENMEDWFGDLTPEQLDKVDQVTGQLEFNRQNWLDSRKGWQGALRESLEEPAGSREREASLKHVILNPSEFWTPEYHRVSDRNRQLFIELMTWLSQNLTAEQRQYALDRLADLRSDFVTLAAN